MVQALDIKGIKLGEGRPKTIISLMGAKVDENIELIEKGIESGVECFEWRGDFAADVHDPQKMAEHSKEIGKALPNNPYLFTFRSTSQGGQLTIPVEEYVGQRDDSRDGQRGKQRPTEERYDAIGVPYPKVENERLRAHGRGFHRDEREEQACHDGNDRSQKEKALLALYHCSSTLSLAGSRQ